MSGVSSHEWPKEWHRKVQKAVLSAVDHAYFDAADVFALAFARFCKFWLLFLCLALFAIFDTQRWLSL
jgi:hypothetical protein